MKAIRHVVTNEMYPVFFDREDDYGIPCKFTDTELIFIANAWDQFDQMQELIRKRFEESGGYDDNGKLRA